MDSDTFGKLLLATVLAISVYQEYGVDSAEVATSPKVIESPKPVVPAPLPPTPPKPDTDSVFREVLAEAKHHADDFISKDGAKNILKLLENLYNKKLSSK